MKRICVALMLLSTGCASIVSRSHYNIPVRSNVEGTLVTVRDRQGNICASRQTPTDITLRSGSGFFSRGQYTFTFEKDGYYGDVQKRTARMDGWYWGNLIFGGLLGLVIIDPATGAMFKLDENPVNAHLVQNRNWKTAPHRQPAATPAVQVAVPATATVSAPAAPKPPAATTAAPVATPARPAAPVPRQASPASTAEKLKQLRDSGTITQEEFEALLLRSIQQKKGNE